MSLAPNILHNKYINEAFFTCTIKLRLKKDFSGIIQRRLDNLFIFNKSESIHSIFWTLFQQIFLLSVALSQIILISQKSRIFGNLAIPSYLILLFLNKWIPLFKKKMMKLKRTVFLTKKMGIFKVQSTQFHYSFFQRFG